MSASLTNLNQFKKQKARVQNKARADENSRKFGRTRAERMTEDKENARENKRLDGHFLLPSEE